MTEPRREAEKRLGRAVHPKALNRLFELWPDAIVKVTHGRYDGQRQTGVQITKKPGLPDWVYGVAVCSVHDQYSRRRGIEIAFRRALRKVPRPL